MFPKTSLVWALAFASASEPVLGRELWSKRDNAIVFPRFSASHERRADSSTACPAEVTVTVTASAAPTISAAACATVITVTVTASATTAVVASSTSVTSSTSTAIPSSSASLSGADFGSCTAPEITFAAGLDGRKETAFETTPGTSFNHGSADNIAVITSFICQQLQSSCKANQAALDLCTQATAAANAQPAGQGSQADAFNAVFGFNTDFAAVTEINDQGQAVASASADATSASSGATIAPSAVSTVATPATASGSSSSDANFGSCTPPEIEFGDGFDNRKETAFQPVDKVSYNHGSADNIAVITQFMCNTLTNTCNANQAAKDLCSQATTAAAAATVGSGGQADAFNKIFGFDTDFASLAIISNTGTTISAGAATISFPTATLGSQAAATLSVAVDVASTTAAASSSVAATVSSSAAIASSSSVSLGDADFGSCTAPEIQFAAGFDNRKETSFEPVNQADYNHGSAQNIDIITQFMCDQLTNTCKANQAAKDLCTQASAAADAQPAKTGQQADAFNAVFGFSTNFASVQPLDDQGNPVNLG